VMDSAYWLRLPQAGVRRPMWSNHPRPTEHTSRCDSPGGSRQPQPGSAGVEGLPGAWGAERSDSDGGNWGGPTDPSSSGVTPARSTGRLRLSKPFSAVRMSSSGRGRERPSSRRGRGPRPPSGRRSWRRPRTAPGARGKDAAGRPP
jgi:hypothetical protein